MAVLSIIYLPAAKPRKANHANHRKTGVQPHHTHLDREPGMCRKLQASKSLNSAPEKKDGALKNEKWEGGFSAIPGLLCMGELADADASTTQGCRCRMNRQTSP